VNVLAWGLRRIARSTWSVVVVVLVWELIARTGLVNAYLLPPPSAVLARLVAATRSGQLAADTWVTVYRTLCGFGIAVGIGGLVGLWMGRSRAVEWLLEPIVSIMFSTPKISFLPIFILWFGTFDASKILMAAFICAFPVISACHAGAKDINRLLPWVGQNIGMNERRIMRKIVLPSALPAWLSGAQIALPFAFIAIAVSEMMAGGGGLGARMMLAARFADSASVVASLSALAVVGLVMTVALERVRMRLLRWHTEVQAAAA